MRGLVVHEGDIFDFPQLLCRQRGVLPQGLKVDRCRGRRRGARRRRRHVGQGARLRAGGQVAHRENDQRQHKVQQDHREAEQKSPAADGERCDLRRKLASQSSVHDRWPLLWPQSAEDLQDLLQREVDVLQACGPRRQTEEEPMAQKSALPSRIAGGCGMRATEGPLDLSPGSLVVTSSNKALQRQYRTVVGDEIIQLLDIRIRHQELATSNAAIRLRFRLLL
mmetsp:Transcript_69490/g.175191  ORF Transcript_69490/g.175191 Transcript_69490/m.175191 type:complete len:223 (+) Transcript_69490:188-856(+)